MGLFGAADRELARPRLSQRQGRAPRGRGFTLMELMVVVAIVAILAAVGYPSYTSHIRKGYRAAAQSYLMDLAQKQTQYLLDNRAYAGNEAALKAMKPTDVNNNYDIGFDVDDGPPPSFKITAAPKVGSRQAGDVTLSITQAGQKLPVEVW